MTIENYFQTFYPRIFTLDMILSLIEMQIKFLILFLPQDYFSSYCLSNH